MSYFEDASAVIFLAPLSAFDQKLAEDRSINRLEDSLLLWKSICASKLLANVSSPAARAQLGLTPNGAG
jgi:guanine nucleotide-binding protein alpha-1 subunit